MVILTTSRRPRSIFGPSRKRIVKKREFAGNLKRRDRQKKTRHFTPFMYKLRATYGALLDQSCRSHVSMCMHAPTSISVTVTVLTACTGAQSCAAACSGISWPVTRGVWARRARASLRRCRRRSLGGDRSACFSPRTPPHPGSPETAAEIKIVIKRRRPSG